jgi:hypothetical protein
LFARSELTAQPDCAIALEHLRFAAGTVIYQLHDQRVFVTPPNDWERQQP